MEPATLKNTQRPRLAEAVFENLSEGVTVADFAVPDAPLIYVNRAFERLTGYAAEEVIGHNCRFLHRGESEQPGLELVRKSLRDGVPCTAVLRNYRKDGTLFYNELHLSPIRAESGEVLYYIGIQRDVTDRVNTEEALWRLNEDLIEVNRNLNNANQRLGELLYVAAHDIKSPLTSIILSLELLQDKVGGMRPAEQKRQIGHLRVISRHIRDIVVEMLEARQVEAGKAELRREPIDLALKAKIVLRFYREPARAKRISLKLIVPRHLPKARADRNSVLAVLDNLISNAVKYSPAGGTVTVRLSRHDRRVRVEVQDQGSGISAEEMPKLFGRFVKLSTQPTGGEHSTGLGLYIVKKFVEMMKGRVWCESTPGKGSTFVVELPRVAQRARQSMRK